MSRWPKKYKPDEMLERVQSFIDLKNDEAWINKRDIFYVKGILHEFIKYLKES